MVRLAILRQRVLEELAHLAAALADERQHDGVEALGAREHGQKRRFADAGAGEDADALAGADGREQVDDADASLEWCAHAVAAHGGRRLTVERIGLLAIEQRALTIDGRAERVDDATFPRGVRMQAQITVLPGDLADAGVDRGIERFHRRASLVDAHDLSDLGVRTRLQADALTQTQVA